MTQEMNLAELQELKEQFALFSRKLDKLAIINDNMLKEAMTRHVSVIEREYKSRFLVSLIGAPVLTVVFLAMGYHWGFILLMDAMAAAEFILDRRCYKVLAPQRLATERTIRYRKLRSLIHRILLIPGIALIVWTVLIACGYRLNLPVLTVSLVAMVVAVEIGIYREKKVNRNLDDMLRRIKQLKA